MLKIARWECLEQSCWHPDIFFPTISHPDPGTCMILLNEETDYPEHLNTFCGSRQSKRQRSLWTSQYQTPFLPGIMASLWLVETMAFLWKEKDLVSSDAYHSKKIKHNELQGIV